MNPLKIADGSLGSSPLSSHSLSSLLYRGYVLDVGTGLYYLQSRYYNSLSFMLKFIQDREAEWRGFKQAVNDGYNKLVGWIRSVWPFD